jgi:hypothetical protein
MPMNRVQFQPGLSMPEFLGRFGSGCRVSARDTCRGLLLPTGLAQWRQLILCRGRPRSLCDLWSRGRKMTSKRPENDHNRRATRNLAISTDSGHSNFAYQHIDNLSRTDS